MGKFLITVFFLVLLLLKGSLTAQTIHDKYDFAQLKRNVQSWVDSGYYNGASLLVSRNNKLIYKEYFGSYTADSVVYIASAGKWLAAATIAVLVDERKLSWDDKVKKWLPEFTDLKGEATLRQLLSHTSGYPDYQPKGRPRDDYQTLKESVAEILDLAADTLPGTSFKYGGLAMQVAGRMAELASGKEWEDLFQEKIARPLRMSSTHFTPVDSGGGHSPMLGGGARTSLQDYANFLNMIFNEGMFDGKPVLSPEAIKEMQADQVRGAVVKAGELVENVRASLRRDIYGLGQWREEVNQEGKAMLISSPSWAGAYPWIDKTTGVYGFFLTHVNPEKAKTQGFSSFLSSPVLPLLVRDAIKDAETAGVTRGYAEVDDNGKLFYEESGRGTPVIFIHGHSFDHYQWDPQFYEMAKIYRAIRYDVRGYGRSSIPREFSSSMHARDLVQLMERLHIKKAHIIGLSMGGFIATDLLALYPERLLSVIAASGDVWGSSPGPSVPWSEEAITKRRQEITEYRNKGVHLNKQMWWQSLTTRNGQVLESIRRPIWDMIYKWDAWQPTHVEPRFLFLPAMPMHIKKISF